MKKFLRSIVFYVFALWLTSTLITSLSITGNAWGMLSAGFMLTLMMVILKPLVSLIFLPINILTLGLLSWVTNVIVLYIWTVFVPNVSISPWEFAGWNVAGFIIPSARLNVPWTLVVVSVMIMLIVSLLDGLDEH